MRAFLFYLSCLFSFAILTLSVACNTHPKNNIERGFYYWRSTFQVTPKEQSALQSLSIQHLYIKFFDVAWNETHNEPRPIATIRFSEQPTTPITPVVFITNETLLQADSIQVDQLAFNISKLLSGITTNNRLALTSEVQIDCDWTVSTTKKYFHLLQQLRGQPFFFEKKLSATIRLHQLKFSNQTGVPPVDKGLLMCYNMGNIRSPVTKNSIIETAELDRYISRLRYYPLQLDIALPLFDWYVWFSKNEYKGLIYPQQLGFKGNQEKITFTRDTVINGYPFNASDWLRFESSNKITLEEAIQHLKDKLPRGDRTVLLYHLNEKLLSKYQNNELKDLFDRFH